MLFTAGSIVTGTTGVWIFISRGLKKKFTPTIISLIVINAMTLMLQASEIVHVYNPYRPVWSIWRNIVYPLCVVLLNLLQLEIFNVFNDGLINIRIFQSQNMKWMRLIVILVHLFLCLPTYLQIWLLPYDDTSLATKRKFQVISAAYIDRRPYPLMSLVHSSDQLGSYIALITLSVARRTLKLFVPRFSAFGIWGVLQNFYILKRIHAHFDSLRSTDCSESLEYCAPDANYGQIKANKHISTGTIHSDCDTTMVSTQYEPPSSAPVHHPTPRHVSKTIRRIQSGARRIRWSIFFLFAMDIFSVGTFITASLVTEEEDRVMHHAMLQISFGVIGMHLFLETFLFTQIVTQFKQQMSASSGSHANDAAESAKNIKRNSAATLT
ncbi:hypothetical protein BSLG_002403 [Batrachochytrium salamandrivorans]|nr:hypothetical protein BSLG_002403 [Batrachochytrium salamandrivorans]